MAPANPGPTPEAIAADRAATKQRLIERALSRGPTETLEKDPWTARAPELNWHPHGVAEDWFEQRDAEYRTRWEEGLRTGFRSTAA